MFLIIGAGSEVGRAAVDALRSDGMPVMGTTRRPVAEGTDRVHLDLLDMPTDWEPPKETRAACIAAAVSRIAECEADPVGSALINCAGTLELVKRLSRRGIYTLFLSTNQIFDGTMPHVAPDTPLRPVSTYGRQKAWTELALRQMMLDGAPVGILRLSKVVSPGTKLFADWRGSLMAGCPIRPFGDMRLAPVPVRLAVRAITVMLRTRSELVAQLTGPRDITYLDAGRHVAALLGADSGLVEAGRAAEIGLPPGATPTHTTLDSSFLRDAHRIVVPDAIDAVGDALLPWPGVSVRRAVPA
jgi:dTDP-4-dehydrorhamnose reductase